MLNSITALITGASRGIGRAIAINMAKNKANIAIIYAGNEEKARETCDICLSFGVNAKIYTCDVSDFDKTKELIANVISDFGGIDILVNNAGNVKDGLVLSMTKDDFNSVIDTNLKGAFNMIKHTYSHFMKKRSGRIINITSVSGIMGNAGQANYSSAKAGMIGLTKSVAKELAARGVTSNAIAPGFIETDMTNALSDKVKEYANNTIPMKKMGSPDDIANLAVFLASDLAGYITGEVIKVDGGLCM
jgi:3-oxoacyl-[acyl-carrier protein] reductase